MYRIINQEQYIEAMNQLIELATTYKDPDPHLETKCVCTMFALKELFICQESTTENVSDVIKSKSNLTKAVLGVCDLILNENPSSSIHILKDMLQ